MQNNIQFDIEKRKQKIKELNEIADTLSGLATKDFENTLQELSGGWDGEASKLFIKKASINGDLLRDVANDIKKE